MTKVKKDGREYTVEDTQVDNYLAKGYSVIDSRGNVLRSGTTSNYDKLIIENGELKNSVRRLEASNDALAKHISTLESDLKSTVEYSDKLTIELSETREELNKLKAKISKKTKSGE